MKKEEIKQTEEIKEIKKERYGLIEVATATGIFIKDNESDEIIDDKAILVSILNKLDNIEKTL